MLSQIERKRRFHCATFQAAIRWSAHERGFRQNRFAGQSRPSEFLRNFHRPNVVLVVASSRATRKQCPQWHSYCANIPCVKKDRWTVFEECRRTFSKPDSRQPKCCFERLTHHAAYGSPCGETSHGPLQQFLRQPNVSVLLTDDNCNTKRLLEKLLPRPVTCRCYPSRPAHFRSACKCCRPLY